MQQTSWLKQNIFIVAAVLLPLLVAALFLIATALPKLYVDPPQYALLVTIEEPTAYPSNDGVEFEVKGNQLTARAIYSKDQRYGMHRKLFRYTPGAALLERVDTPIDDDLRAQLEAELERTSKSEVRQPLPLPQDVAGLALIPSVTAPDGYRFRNNYRGGAGLFGELFGMRSRNRVVAIEKQGRVVELATELDPQHRYSYYNVQFLGWVAND